MDEYNWTKKIFIQAQSWCIASQDTSTKQEYKQNTSLTFSIVDTLEIFFLPSRLENWLNNRNDLLNRNFIKWRGACVAMDEWRETICKIIKTVPFFPYSDSIWTLVFEDDEIDSVKEKTCRNINFPFLMILAGTVQVVVFIFPMASYLP